MKKRKILILIELLIFIFATSYSYATNSNETNGSKVNRNLTNSNIANNYVTDSYVTSSLNGYSITSYNVDMNIDEYGVMDIKEVISIYATTYKHGITRSIPISNTVTRLDGTSYKNHAKITNLQVSENYEADRSDGFLNIKIGDEDRTFKGQRDYIISYTYNIGSDKTDNYDELYYNIIGTKWDTTISNISFKITMPKEFDSSKLGFSAGRYGTSGTSNVTYSVNGNVITGSYNGTLNEYNGLTVRCELPEGYFEKKPVSLSTSDMIIFTIAISTIIIGFLLWNKYGREKKVTETVEFYPPKGLSSLDVGYFYFRKIENQQIISLLIELANKGYIVIEEEKKEGLFTSQNYRIYPMKKIDWISKGDEIEKIKENTGELSNEEKNSYIGSLICRSYNEKIEQNRIEKKEKIKENTGELSNEEKNFYIGLLSCMPYKNNYVTKKDLKYKFCYYADEIRKGEYKKKKMIVEGNKKIQLGIFSIIMLALILPLMLLKNNVNVDFDRIYVIVSIYIAILVSRFITKKTVNYVFLAEFIGVSESIACLGMIFENLGYVDNLYIIELLIVLTAIIANMILCILITNKTDYEIEMLGKIGGFRNFLITAEKEKLEALVNENPQYFYNILPYTYALNVSNKWIKKFEDIAMEPPSWYYYDGSDTFNYLLFMNSFDRNFNSFKNAIISTPQGSDSSFGGSSGGGGFSGGGFSGGGSGGGGGSSW